MTRSPRPSVFALATLTLAGAALSAAAFAAPDSVEPSTTERARVSAPGRGQGQIREFTVMGNEHRFAPGRIEVRKDDLVKVTFTASDIAHSFTIDSYRIAKRAGAGQTVVFEFRADQTGSFPFYCNLTQDDKCRQMKGELVVR
jgi:heme/copper-type cytochrome/quinol oxidase subunit 2